MSTVWVIAMLILSATQSITTYTIICVSWITLPGLSILTTSLHYTFWQCVFWCQERYASLLCDPCCNRWTSQHPCRDRWASLSPLCLNSSRPSISFRMANSLMIKVWKQFLKVTGIFTLTKWLNQSITYTIKHRMKIETRNVHRTGCHVAMGTWHHTLLLYIQRHPNNLYQMACLTTWQLFTAWQLVWWIRARK